MLEVKKFHECANDGKCITTHIQGRIIVESIEVRQLCKRLDRGSSMQWERIIVLLKEF